MRALLFLALVGCGSITTSTAERDAAIDVADRLTPSPDVAPDAATRDAQPELQPAPDAREAPSCAAWSSPPYCSSCRDSRGICRCGSLPCCDQHCQS